MPTSHLGGAGRKRPQVDVSVDRLHLDPQNPRLPEEVQGGSQPELLRAMHKHFALDELAESMARNGYFHEEPLVAFPIRLPPRLRTVPEDHADFVDYVHQPDTEFTVVEGNRRLATAKILLSATLRTELGIRHWPAPTSAVAHDLKVIPVIAYRRRADIVPYLGVRHIVGIRKWDSYAKARYIAALVEAGSPLSAVEAQIGDKRSSVRRNYLAFKLLEQVEDEFDLDVSVAKDDFSFLLLALGQGEIKRFLGLPASTSDVNFRRPIKRRALPNLKDLVVWLYGQKQEKPIIRESRDITRYLSTVVSNPEAIAYLKKTGNLQEAWDRSGGEEKMLVKYLSDANRRMEAALGIVHRHRTTVVVEQARMCAETAQQLVSTVTGKN